MSSAPAPRPQSQPQLPSIRDFIFNTAKEGQVLMMRGAPGSGKSTLIHQLQDLRHDLWPQVFSADKERMVNGIYIYDASKNDQAHMGCFRKFIAAAQDVQPAGFSGRILIVDNTNCSSDEYTPYYAVARAYQWEPVLVTVETDPEIAAARNTHNVPVGKVRAMAERLRRSEAHIPPKLRHIKVQGE